MRHDNMKAMDGALILDMNIADSWATRMRGLLGTTFLAEHQALWLKPCNAIHTIGMKYPIAVHFLDKKGSVIRSVGYVRPWRLVFCLAADSVIEMPGVRPEQLSRQIYAIQATLKHRANGADLTKMV